ncbi:MAG: Coenzyme F420 hydrogenase/dehydrogenase, beta subunit C-terminal domain [Clostridia bacterium]|nr:Coenzyme F420 hydrogenase/dehydrogenase, beta subunit C-terminal domain [Clostridia bacterium]
MIDAGKKCTACGACKQVCPVACITMQEDENGFLKPIINTEQCIGCNRCLTVCPIEMPLQEVRSKAYAVVSRNLDFLSAATSGGAFGVIASFVIENGGVVYGCAYGEALKPMHMRVETKSALEIFFGSKYIQSDTGETFVSAQRDLKENKLVLFSGTPCQIAGLKAFLGKEYDNLLTVDLICHGVPSYAYFRKYLDGLEEKEKMVITDFSFRSKKNRGWSVNGTFLGYQQNYNRKKEKKLNNCDSYYYSYFLEGDIYRESCYTCKYATLQRVGDFTLGDFWGAEGADLPFSVKKGCSLVLVNTNKANDVFPKLNFLCQEISIEDACKFNGQLNKPTKVSARREELLRQYREFSSQEIEKFYKKNNKKKIFIKKLKNLIPVSIKNVILKMRYARRKQ